MESQDYQNILSENGVLKCKLESKSEAITILTRELEVCRSERDQFKLMAEQLRDRYSTLKKRVEGWGPSLLSVYDVQGFKRKGEQNLAQLLCELKEQNKTLKAEVSDLRQKLSDAQGDVKLLREQIAQSGPQSETLQGEFCASLPSLKKQDLVKELETVRHKYSLLERDLQSVLDEKEELVVARDAYLHKVERLNKQLSKMLHGEEHIIDIDAVIMENRYLQERVKQIQEEKAMVTATLSKYKNILEKKRSRGNIRLTGPGGNLVITNKQVQQLLQSSSFLQMPETPNTVAELQSLIIALYEALNDKSLALTHQKKANKLLGNRLTELEKKMKMMESVHWTNYESRNSTVLAVTAELEEIDDYQNPAENTSEVSDEFVGNIHSKYENKANDDFDSPNQCLGSYQSNDAYEMKVQKCEQENNLGDLDFLPTRDTQHDEDHVNSSDQIRSTDCKSTSPLPTSSHRISESSSNNEELVDLIAESERLEYFDDGAVDDDLPPHLQKLIDLAMKEIDSESPELDISNSIPCLS